MVVFLVEPKEDLQVMVDKLGRASGRMDLQINVDKTKGIRGKGDLRGAPEERPVHFVINTMSWSV